MRARASSPAGAGVTVRKVSGVARLLMSAAGVIGIIANYGYVLGFATFVTSNFFSYFTIQSAIAAVVMFVLAAVMAFRRPEDPAWLDTLRSIVTTYIIVSGIVFAIMVIESGTRDYRIDVPWSDRLLHFWIPAFALIDWLFDPHKARLGWRGLRWVLVYPVLWGIFTLIRGSIVGWYPYFFLDLAQVTIPEMVFYCGLAMALFFGVAAGLTATTRVHMSPWWSRRDHQGGARDQARSG